MCLGSIIIGDFSPLVLLHFPYCYCRMLFMQLIKYSDGKETLGFIIYGDSRDFSYFWQSLCPCYFQCLILTSQQAWEGGNGMEISGSPTLAPEVSIQLILQNVLSEPWCSRTVVFVNASKHHPFLTIWKAEQQRAQEHLWTLLSGRPEFESQSC